MESSRDVLRICYTKSASIKGCLRSLGRMKNSIMIEEKTTVTIAGVDYMLDATVARRPVNVYLKAASNPVTGAYVYSIGNGREVFSTVLQMGDNVDVVRSVSQLLSRKFGAPAYVYMDGSIRDVYAATEKIVGELGQADSA